MCCCPVFHWDNLWSMSRYYCSSDWAELAIRLCFLLFHTQLPHIPCLLYHHWRGANEGRAENFFGCDAAESKMDLVSLLRPHPVRGFRTSPNCCLTGHMPCVTGAQVHNCHLKKEGKSVLSPWGCLQYLHKIAFRCFFS